jgi:hypothetical protein
MVSVGDRRGHRGRRDRRDHRRRGVADGGGDRLRSLRGRRQLRGDVAGGGLLGGVLRAWVPTIVMDSDLVSKLVAAATAVVYYSFCPSLRLLSLSNEFIIQRY